MFRRFVHSLSDERGTELLEAALTLPIAVLVLVSAVNLGIAVYAGQMAKEAARHGARMGSVAQENPTGIAASEALNFAQSTFAIGDPRVAILSPGGVSGSILKVRVTYQVPNFMSGFAGMFPGVPTGPFEVVGEATARQEGW